MRFSLAAVVVSFGLLASCAYQGVIVDKSARELPFGETTGMGGSFAFLLKDNSGVVRRQLVTPDVFTRYEVGDYFNDTQPGPVHQQRSSDGKTMLTTANSAPQSVSTRTAVNHKSRSAHLLAHKGEHKRHHALAAAKRVRAKKIVPTVKTEVAPTVAATAEPAPTVEVAYVGVAHVKRVR